MLLDYHAAFDLFVLYHLPWRFYPCTIYFIEAAACAFSWDFPTLNLFLLVMGRRRFTIPTYTLQIVAFYVVGDHYYTR